MNREDQLIDMQNDKNEAISIIPILWGHDCTYGDYLCICEDRSIEPVSRDEYQKHLKTLDNYFTDNKCSQVSSEVLHEDFIKIIDEDFGGCSWHSFFTKGCLDCEARNK